MQAWRRLRSDGGLPIWRRVTRLEPEFLLFASDAEIMALWGGLCLLLAGFAGVMERRRMKRAQIHRVGWVPWTAVFMLAMLMGGALLAVALPVVIMG